ncbi:TPA_asm: hypothetical protein GahPV1_gp18 [Geoglobus ahangari pleomorphic virus 1]|uniref:Uncharacterized protein n=2 Tax=root TaxID=1 RepID=A0A0F7DC86_9EURY|nr:DUF6731 family protein [Geoglobus ahangari]AKG92406.1 hypothetical protein GAH_00238 [Geoglobus ahangari]
MASSVERKIYFYTIKVAKDGKHVNSLEHIFRHINELDYSLSPDGRILPIDGGTDHMCMLLDSAKYPIRGMLGLIRKDALPLIFKEDTGDTSGIEIDPENEGLYEPIHFIIWKLGNSHIIGVEYNFYGPRPQRISWYLQRVAREHVDRVIMQPIMRKDISSKLEKYDEIKILKMRFNPNKSEIFRELDESLPDAINAIGKATNSKDVYIVLKPDYRKRKGILGIVPKQFKKILGRGDVTDIFSLLQIKAKNIETGEFEWLDLLNELIVSKKTVTRLDIYRCVDSSDMFEKIKEAYYDHKDEIKEVIGINNVSRE